MKFPSRIEFIQIFIQNCVAFAHDTTAYLTPTGDGLTREFVRLFTQHGIQDVQTRVSTPVYRAGTESGRYFYNDMTLSLRMLLPFFQKWACVPDDYQELCDQARHEMQQPGFVATWTLLTAWGTRPA